MFQVKICGVTCPEDARVVVRAGADAIGINFFSRSKRFVRPELASKIVAQIPASVCKIGVFVNASTADMRKLARTVGLDAVQLHGDEPAQMLDELSELPVVRAFRYQGRLRPVLDYLANCKRKPMGVLLDAYDPRHYGGTGRCLEWDELQGISTAFDPIPVILAGGLTPVNVNEAITLARPSAVDVAGGVEREPGRKDPELVSQFVQQARAAFAG